MSLQLAQGDIYNSVQLVIISTSHSLRSEGLLASSVLSDLSQPQEVVASYFNMN